MLQKHSCGDPRDKYRSGFHPYYYLLGSFLVPDFVIWLYNQLYNSLFTTTTIIHSTATTTTCCTTIISTCNNTIFTKYCIRTTITFGYDRFSTISNPHQTSITKFAPFTQITITTYTTRNTTLATFLIIFITNYATIITKSFTTTTSSHTLSTKHHTFIMFSRFSPFWMF